MTTGIAVDEAARRTAGKTSRRRALGIAGSLALLIGSLAVGGWQIWQSFRLHAGQFDFSAYYAAARALSLDHTANIYSPHIMAANAIAGHVLAPPTLLYVYPPLLAILMIPLAHVSFANAATIFLVINTALWLCCTLLIANEVRLLLGSSLALEQAPAAPSWRGRAIRLYRDPAPLVSLAVTCAIFFISRPAWATLGLGQINFLVLLPLAAIPWLTRHGHERWVGVVVALVIMIKLTPIVLLAYLILRRRWQAVATAMLVLLALAALCALFIGPTVFAQFPAASLRVGSSDALEAHNEALFAGFISVIVANAPALASVVRAVEYLLLAALATVGAVILWRAAPRAGRVDHAGEMAAFSLALCGIVLLSPTAWAHHYVWLLPGSAIVLALTIRAFAAGRLGSAGSRQLFVLLALSVVAAVFLDLPLPFGWDTDPAVHHTLFGLELRPWLQELRPLGGLLLACVAAWLALGMRRGGPDHEVASVAAP